MKSAIRNPQSAIACIILLALSQASSLVRGAEPEKALTLPDVKAIVKEREKAVVRVETYEYFISGLARRGVRLLDPLPLTSNIGDAFSFAFYLPSLVFSKMREHLGSGVLLDAQGYVVTNNHVVKGADSFVVRLTDAKGVERRFDAAVVATDPQVDIAIVKIDPGKFPLVTAPLGDSDQLALGDWIIAIGNPLRLTGSVSLGVVSGLHRQVGQNLLEDFIQVDAAVNPGNSGGPIVNTRGEVVGLVDLGLFPATGIGFAIPTNLITPFLDDLKQGRRPSRGYLGAGLRDLNPELAKTWKLDVETGVLVAAVRLFGPAARGGLKEGDVLETVGGKKVATAREAQMAVLRTPPDTELPVGIRRGGKAVELKVKLGTRRAPVRIF